MTAEIYVMGILKEYHRNGLGHLLWEAFLEYAKEHGYEYVQVKTVKKGQYKEYDITNAFYEKNDLIYILLETDREKKNQLFQQLYDDISQNLVPVRPNRHYHQTKGQLAGKYSNTHKRAY